TVGDAREALYWISENAKWDGLRVSPTNRGWDHAGCLWPANSCLIQEAYGKGRQIHSVPIRYEALINSAHTDATRLATLAHELGHLYCGHAGTHDKDLWPDRSGTPEEMRELEAESVAKVVFQRRYPGVELPDHLSQFFKGEIPSLDGLDLERVLTAAGRILETADGYRPRRSKIRRPDLHGMTKRE
ncbi:ImmA/IrrE family metallo-endopeptidase, partial [Intrasporangium chromatireducens]